MQILVLNYEYPPLGGGAAPVSRDIAYELKKYGHKVTVLTMGFGNLQEHEMDNGVEVYRLKCMRKHSFACQPWEAYSYLLAVRKFMRKHKELQKYDVCHTHFIIPTGEVAYHIYKKYRIPYIITSHGSDVEGYNKKKYLNVMHYMLRPFWRKIVKNAYKVVSPSIFLKDLMEKHYRTDKYEIIQNGIDLNRYKELYSKENRKEKSIIVMGRMQSYKNVQTILKALENVNVDGWEINILGDGPYREQLEYLAKELKITEKINFRGWIQNNSDEQMEYLAKASIYISASLVENCPMSVIEATASGCYPLLSDIPAHRQLISEDEYYFEPENSDMLAKKLQKVMKRENSPYQYDLKRFDWSNIAKKYEKLLNEAR